MNIKGFFMREIRKDKKDKHFILDQITLKKAQSLLGTKTETETIEIALEQVITESEKEKKALSSQERFVGDALKEGLFIEDVFGRLDKK